MFVGWGIISFFANQLRQLTGVALSHHGDYPTSSTPTTVATSINNRPTDDILEHHRMNEDYSAGMAQADPDFEPVPLAFPVVNNSQYQQQQHGRGGGNRYGGGQGYRR